MLFQQTMVMPAVLYVPVLFGFTMACLAQEQTQEPGFGICLLVIEPVLALRTCYLIRDACRRGLNAHTFFMPLGKSEWRWLYASLVFHLGLAATGGVLFAYANGPGRLLLALEASLRLRAVRPHPTVCPVGEVHMTLMLLGACATVVLVGHCTVQRTKAAIPYRAAWKLGVTLPALCQGIVVCGCLFTCIDTQQTQELVLYIGLASV